MKRIVKTETRRIAGAVLAAALTLLSGCGTSQSLIPVELPEPLTELIEEQEAKHAAGSPAPASPTSSASGMSTPTPEHTGTPAPTSTPAPVSTPSPTAAPTPTPTATPAPDGALVRDAWTGTCPGAYGGTYHIPEIVLEGRDVAAVNREIEDYLAAARRDAESGNSNPAYAGIDYSWYRNGDCLSLLIRAQTYGSDWIDYLAFNVWISTGTRATTAELASQAGMSVSDYERRVKEALGSRCWDCEANQFLDITHNAQDRESFGELLDQTLDPENLSWTQPYLGSNGHLWIAGRYGVSAGRGMTSETLDLETFTVSPNYSETLPLLVRQNDQVVSTMYIVGVTNSAYLRAEPSPDGEILGTVPLGAPVGFVEETGEFSRVCYEGRYGYVRSEFLSPVGGTDETDPFAPMSNGDHVVALEALYMPMGSAGMYSDNGVLGMLGYVPALAESLEVGDDLDVGYFHTVKIRSIQQVGRDYSVNGGEYGLEYDPAEDTYWIRTPQGYAYEKLEFCVTEWVPGAVIEVPGELSDSGRTERVAVEDFFLDYYTPAEDLIVLEIDVRGGRVTSARWLQVIEE